MNKNKSGAEWLETITHSFENIIEKVASGEIDIDKIERLQLIDESQELPGGNTSKLKPLQLDLIKHINHYFTRVVKTNGELDNWEVLVIETKLKSIIAELRKLLFG